MIPSKKTEDGEPLSDQAVPRLRGREECQTAKQANNEMLEAAGMLAQGMSPSETAKRLGRSESTIRRWMKQEEVRGAYREAILRTALVSYGRALRRLGDQLDAENETVAQRAAKDIIDRFGEVIMKESDREIVVLVVGAPEIGMPEEAEQKA